MATLTLGTTNLSTSGGNWSSAPAGTVVQSATTTATGSVAVNSSDISASGLITTLTPRLSGSKFLTILSGVNAHSNKTSSDNHGTIYYMYASVNGGSYANVAANVTGSHHIDGNLGAWIDVPLTMTFLSTPSYTVGQSVAFQPYYARATSSSGTVYFHHTGHSAAASQVYNLTVLEIAS
jgi:hypothetical protein